MPELVTIGAAPAPAARWRNPHRRIPTVRWIVQGLYLAFLLLVGWEFWRFWSQATGPGPVTATRPPSVEAFLPISALVGLKRFVLTGEWDPVHPAGLAILLAALVGALAARKAFCGWVCPVGTLSRALEWLGRKTLWRRRWPAVPRWIDLPLSSLKYLLLAFFLYAVFFQMGPQAVADFLDSPYNRVADAKMLYFFERLTPVGVRILGALALLSLVVPYFWCRYLCPYGALLGALSLLSPLKVTRHAASCIDCSLCTKACPARLPVERLRRVRSDECFGCLSCVAACPVPRALRVEAPRPLGRAVRPAAFAALVLGLFFGGILLAKTTGFWQTSVGAAEYSQRVKELDGPGYDHLQGRAGAATAKPPAVPGPASD
jgi:polyferredoxin